MNHGRTNEIGSPALISSINNECGPHAGDLESGLSYGLGDLKNNENGEPSLSGDRREMSADHWPDVNNSAVNSQPRSASSDAIKTGAPEQRTIICDRCYLSKRPEPLSAFAGDLSRLIFKNSFANSLVVLLLFGQTSGRQFYRS